MWVKRIFATISIKDLEVRLLLNSTKKVYYFCKKEHTASLLYLGCNAQSAKVMLTPL